MRVSRETFGVSLTRPLEQAPAGWEALLEEVAQAGAGAVRAPWSGVDDPPARQSASAALRRGLALVAVCDPAALRPEGVAGLGAAGAAGGSGCTLELRLERETATAVLGEALMIVGERPVVLGFGPAEAAAPLPEGPDRGPLARVVALGVEVTAGEEDDPKRIEAPLRGFAAGLRERGLQQPIWVTLVEAPPASSGPASRRDAVPQRAGGEGCGHTAADARVARLLKYGAHALALGVPKLFLRLWEEEAGPTLRALRTFAAWLDGAQRITWLARGQYRAEFVDRPNRYLLWADPEIRRVPSSLQGPLAVRDLAGDERRVETSNLRLTESPVLVERPRRPA
jgi:hypothetical protein